MPPRFSVIVPVYNVQNYLAQSVGSVLQQSGTDWECILVDDGSTDKSGAMCDSFAKLCPAVKAIHQKNRGLAGARNTGIRAATGEWLLFLDSDDYWPDTLLSDMRTVLARQPDFDLYVGSYQELDDTTGAITPPKAVHLVPGPMTETDYAGRVKRFYDSAHWSVWKLCVNRQFLLQHNLFFWEESIYAEDLPWDLQMLRTGARVYFSPQIMCIYRADRPGSLMNVNMAKHFRGYLGTLQKFEAEFAAGMLADQQAEVLGRLADSFWPDMRAAAVPDKAARHACLPYIRQLKVLYKRGSQCRGRVDYTLYRWLLCAFGPRFTLWAGSLLHR